MKLEKISRKKNYLAVGVLYLLNVPAGGANDDDEVCCRSPSILNSEVKSFLVIAFLQKLEFPVIVGKFCYSSSPYRWIDEGVS